MIKTYKSDEINYYIDYLEHHFEPYIISAFRDKKDFESWLTLKQLKDDYELYISLLGQSNKAETIRQNMIKTIERIYKIKVEKQYFLLEIKL